jgi:uncharacterized ion transporter superfamily protein YfcC
MTIIQIVCLIVVILLAVLGGFLLVKKSKKNTVMRWIGLVSCAILLICASIFWHKAATLMSFLIVVYLAILFGYLIVTKSEKYSLAKWVLLFLFVSVAFTWIFNYGSFNGTELVSYGLNQMGLADFSNMLYYAMNFAGDKIIYLLAVGAFYAVLNRSEGYKKVVTGIASYFKGKELLFSIIASLIIALMTATLSQTFIVIAVLPFVISILLNMKLDKLTAFAVTFGSVLVGSLGLIYGGESLYSFSYYAGIDFKKVAITYRAIIFAISYILFNIFVLLHARKVLEDKKLDESKSDPFVIEKVDKKAKVWPIVLVLIVTFIFIILGYTAWESTFNVKIFSDLHNWFVGLKINGFDLFQKIIGTKDQTAALGSWSMLNATMFLTILSIITALVSKIKLDDFIDSYKEGIIVMIKPVALYVGVYMILVAAYNSPFVPTVINIMFKSVDKFNPYLVSLGAMFANIFHSDLGLTSYFVGKFFVTKYAANVETIHMIFTTMYGFCGLFLPTSAILLIGLSYLDLDYKSWIKYIWKFLLIILAILLIVFTILTYL